MKVMQDHHKQFGPMQTQTHLYADLSLADEHESKKGDKNILLLPGHTAFKGLSFLSLQLSPGGSGLGSRVFVGIVYERVDPRQIAQTLLNDSTQSRVRLRHAAVV
eukprot:m.1556207 g.1556207  ORF g.1556207 m.1556207 type:complete len:105 (-) comp25272_c2_seq11:2374-2688(-)